MVAAVEFHVRVLIHLYRGLAAAQAAHGRPQLRLWAAARDPISHGAHHLGVAFVSFRVFGGHGSQSVLDISASIISRSALNCSSKSPWPSANCTWSGMCSSVFSVSGYPWCCAKLAFCDFSR